MKKKIINNHQQGAALVIVMAFLAAGLIVGISGMNASYIDERLADNYQASSSAQNAAESAASLAVNIDGGPGEDDFKESSYSVENISDISWNEFLDNSKFNSHEALDGSCDKGYSKCFYRYVAIKNSEGEDFKYIISLGSVGGDFKAISRPVLVELQFPALPDLTSIDGAVSCSGSDCFYDPGSGKASPSVDGTNRPKNVKIQGSIKNMDTDLSSPGVAGIVMPDILSTNGAGSGGGGYDGAPGEVYSDSDKSYEDLESVVSRANDGDNIENWTDAKSRINDYIKKIIEVSDYADNDSFYYAGKDEIVSPGSSEGIVVVNGGTLSLKGNDAFRGLVIVSGEEGCADDADKSCGIIEAGGTSAIVGAVIGRNYTFSGNGTPSIYYSREAIESSQSIEISGDNQAKVVSWK